jgi:hypothetical protein
MRSGLCAGTARPAPEHHSHLTAIDILLEPDATMLQRAQADNAGLLKIFPRLFTRRFAPPSYHYRSAVRLGQSLLVVADQMYLVDPVADLLTQLSSLIMFELPAAARTNRARR